MKKIFLFLGALLGGFSVALGAFAAHGMHGMYSDYTMELMEKAVRYEMYHSLAMVAVAILMHLSPQERLFKLAGYFFLAGTILFPGSLYLIAFTGVKSLGVIAPFGGTSFLLGWGILAAGALRWMEK